MTGADEAGGRLAGRRGVGRVDEGEAAIAVAPDDEVVLPFHEAAVALGALGEMERFLFQRVLVLPELGGMAFEAHVVADQDHEPGQRGHGYRGEHVEGQRRPAAVGRGGDRATQHGLEVGGGRIHRHSSLPRQSLVLIEKS